jgi:simple sugar transport system permease protein
MTTRSNRKILAPFVSLLIAFIIGGVVIALIGKNPVEAYVAIFRGAFTDWGFTLFQATSLIFSALAVAIAFHCGLFNIGANGQLMMGALAAAYVSLRFAGLPGVILLPTVVFAAICVGALWGFVPGALKATRGTNEVVVTIMMNYIAISVVSYALTYSMKDPASWIAQSAMLPESLWLPSITLGADPMIVVAVIMSVLSYVFLWRTRMGYELRAVGFNQMASSYAGIKVRRAIALTMCISGAIAALSYYNYLFAYQYRAVSDVIVGTNVGFDAITAALLARNNPLLVIVSSLFLAALYSGGLTAQFELGVPSSFYLFLEGVIIFSVVMFSTVLGGKDD